MKILHISTWDRGGAAAAAKRLFTAQNKMGIEAFFLSKMQQEAHVKGVLYYEDYLKKKYGALGMKLIKFLNKIYNQIPLGFNQKIFFNRPTTLYRVHKHPLVKQADIIHLHSTAKFIDFPSFFKHIQKPIVWTLHDMNPCSGGKHYDIGMDKRYASLESQYVRIKKNAVQGRKLHIVGPSTWLQGVSERSAVFGAFPHSHIPYCIDPAIFKAPQNTAETKQGKKQKILFVAENILDKRKGFTYLLDALPHLKKDIEILVIGNANKEQFAAYDNITFLGFITDRAQLASIYTAADTYVIASLEDNLPNTIIESHLCGTPVVGFRTSGIEGMIQHKKTGILVDTISGAALAEGIHSALDLVQKRPSMQNDIQVWAAAYYAEKKVVTAYQKIYQSMLIQQQKPFNTNSN